MRKSTNFCRLFLILGAILLLIVAAGCGEANVTDPTDATTGETMDKNISFRAKTYIQFSSFSWWYSIDVEVTDGKIYLNGELYEISSIAAPAISYEEFGLLIDAAYKDEKNGNTKMVDTLTAIQNSEPYCVLENSESGSILPVYKIDGVYYFVSTANGEVTRIHYGPVQGETEK